MGSYKGEPKLNYDRMLKLRRMYGQDAEPEPGSPEAGVFWAVKAAADYLCSVDREEYIDCLWCPNRFLSIEDDIRNYHSDIYYNCEEDCIGSYYDTGIMCGDYLDVLGDYYRSEETDDNT